MILALLFFGLALLSIALNLWQWAAGRSFPPRRSESPASFTPPLSLLKPLKGCDSETEACLESWFQQDYPEYEIHFAVADSGDPAIEIVRRLLTRYPSRAAELHVCQPVLGPNAKVSSLCYMARVARFDYLVVADQDVRVKPEFLRALSAPLQEPGCGLVNCFYIQATAPTFAMKLEAVAVNADFWTQVLQGNQLRKMDFALGAVMALSKRALCAAGGFEALLDYLADDYQLGNRVAKTGASLRLCGMPVECRSEPQSPAEVWRHQLRWARTIRVCQPGPYFFSILSNGTLWPLVCALILGGQLASGVLAAALAVRILTAASNSARFTRHLALWPGFLAPVKDLFSAATWALSFLGNEVTWRGQRFHVSRGGKLTPL